jgi:anaerobic selenocysteine-containing dehydrogenase
VGVSTQELGGVCHLAAYVLNAVTGNLDRQGGAMFTRRAVDLVALGDRIGQRGHFAKGTSRVRGLPEFGGEWPAAVLAEEMETPGPGQIRAFVSLAGNPVLSTPTGAGSSARWPASDFMVSIDPYLNETSRHAHLVLPPVSPLERDHYDLVFHVLAVRNTARYSAAALHALPADAARGLADPPRPRATDRGRRRVRAVARHGSTRARGPSSGRAGSWPCSCGPVPTGAGCVPGDAG